MPRYAKICQEWAKLLQSSLARIQSSPFNLAGLIIDNTEYKFIIVIIDCLLKEVILLPYQSLKILDIAEAFLASYYPRYRIPISIVLD